MQNTKGKAIAPRNQVRSQGGEALGAKPSEVLKCSFVPL